MKRKIPYSRNHRRYVPIKFTNAPNWLDDDYLSNLPEDCLLNIHLYLDKYSLESLALTSQRMNQTVKRQLSKLPDCRRKLQTLKIVKNSTGHVVVASASESDNFLYYLNQTNRTFLKERVARNINGLRILTPDPSSPFTVDASVRAVKRNLLRKNEFDELRLSGVTVDLNLLNSCKNGLFGKVKRLFVEDINFKLRSRATFDKFVIDSGAEEFMFSASNQNNTPWFTDTFLKDFVENRSELSLWIDVETSHHLFLNETHKFDVIAAFKLLVHHTLILSDAQLLASVNNRLSMNDATARWEFSLLSINNPLFLFQLENTKMARKDEFSGIFTCGRVDNFNSVRIEIRSPPDSNCSLFLNVYPLAIVNFYNHDGWLAFEDIQPIND